MAFVALQGGNRYWRKDLADFDQWERFSALPVILKTYASSSTVSTMFREQ